MDVMSIITQANRDDELPNATKATSDHTSSTNSSLHHHSIPQQIINKSTTSSSLTTTSQQNSNSNSNSNHQYPMRYELSHQNHHHQPTTITTSPPPLYPASIITQLVQQRNSNSNQNTSLHQINSPTINQYTTNSTANNTTNNNNNNNHDDNNPNSPVEIKPYKQRQRGFLSQLLCCFRPPSTAYLPHYPGGKECFQGKYLLPQVKRNDKICLVIDLDETLVHSSFKPINNADFVVPVEIDGAIHQVYVLKRPYVDEFLQRMGQLYECVLFTASLAKYADPVADLLDKKNIFKARLFRESCAFYRGNYVKDLSRLGRDLNRVIIVDNSPASYIFHPDNAVPVASWFDDMSDTELRDLIPFLERLSKADSVYSVLEGIKQNKLLSLIGVSQFSP